MSFGRECSTKKSKTPAERNLLQEWECSKYESSSERQGNGRGEPKNKSKLGNQIEGECSQGKDSDAMKRVCYLGQEARYRTRFIIANELLNN
mmetsp:Transcript_8721/g.18850  ORF Transcript_8721/g.18850 Transcript_8721/m.18850 type:complete len:92 (+) Transcript_8721:1428-1703(+)